MGQARADRLSAKGGKVRGGREVDGRSLSLLGSEAALLVTTSLAVSASSVLSGASLRSLGSLGSVASVDGESRLNLEQNLLLSGSGSHVLGLGTGDKVGGLLLVKDVGLGVLGLGTGVGLSHRSAGRQLGSGSLLLLEVLLEGLGVVGLGNGLLNGSLGLGGSRLVLGGNSIAGLLVGQLALGVSPSLTNLLGRVGLAGLGSSVGSGVSGRLALLLGLGLGGLGPVLVSQGLVGLLGSAKGSTGVSGSGGLLGRAGVLGELLGHNDLVGVLLHVSEDFVKVLG